LFSLISFVDVRYVSQSLDTSQEINFQEAQGKEIKEEEPGPKVESEELEATFTTVKQVHASHHLLIV